MVANPFQMSTGRLDGVVVTVIDAIFAHDEELGDKTGNDLFLKMTVKAEMEGGVEDKDMHFKVGDAWTTRDKGATAVRQDDADVTFNENSAVGIFNNSVMLHGGGEDVLARYKADPTMEPRRATYYEGMKFMLGTINFPARDEFQAYGRSIVAGPETLAGQHMDPDTEPGWIGFVGETGTAPAPAKSAPKAAAKTPAKKAPAAKTPANNGTEPDPAIVAQADTIADECANHDDFMERAYAEIPMEAMTPELEALIKDGEAETGIWMRAYRRYEAAQA